MATAPNALSFRWTKNLSEVAGLWAECFGTGNALRSLELQKAVEASQLEDVNHHYLVVSDEAGVAALIPCFAFKISLLSVADPKIQSKVTGFQKIFPNFLKAQIFVVGSAISNYGDLLGFKEFENQTRWSKEKLSTVFEEVTRKSKELHIGFIIIKELEQEITERLKVAIGDKFFFADSLPTTHLSVQARERGGYFESIRSKYRNKLKKRKAVGTEKGLTWEITHDASAHTEEIYALYLQVVANSDFVFEKVNKAFFTQVSAAFGDKAFYILGFQPQGEGKRLISCELVVTDSETMHPLYSGFDYILKRDSDIYFNAFYQAIEQAETRGFTCMHMGQTAYEVKAELGAQLTKLWVGVRHRNPIIHAFIKRFQKLFFPLVEFPPRDVFSTPPPPPKSGNKNRIDLPQV